MCARERAYLCECACVRALVMAHLLHSHRQVSLTVTNAVLQKETRKCAFLTWIGRDVGVMKRARVPVQKAGVYNAFAGLVADVAILDADSDTLAAVVAKLASDTKEGPECIRLAARRDVL